MHNWDAVKAFYKRHQQKIMLSANEWGVAPYSWESDAGVTLTPIESAVWSDLRMEGAVFYPQYPVLTYFVDFANPVAKVVIECDGKEFHQDKRKDDLRDANLKREGWTVYRFTGSECMKDCREYYDDDGMLIVELAPVQHKLRELINRHDLRIGRHRKPSNIGGSTWC